MPDGREIFLCGSAVVQGIIKAVDRGGDSYIVTTEKIVSRIDPSIEIEKESG